MIRSIVTPVRNHTRSSKKVNLEPKKKFNEERFLLISLCVSILFGIEANHKLSKLARKHGHKTWSNGAIQLIFLDATKSIDTGSRWQTFNGTDLRSLKL